MNTSTIYSLIIVFVILLICFFFYSRMAKTKIETIDYPPFVIKKTNVNSTRYDINTASRRDDSRSYYSVYFRNELITFPPALNENTGVYGLWKVYTLKEASRPALLAGSKSIYLITQENDDYKITTISEKGSDFVSLQWLDSIDGQPGTKQELYSSNDTGKSCDLEGGRFLLLNKNIVLDTEKLSIYPFRISNELTDEYYANQVVAFSSENEQIVYMGSKNYNNGKYEHALVVYNYKTNNTSILPFDRNETRLHVPFDADYNWLNSFFEWKRLVDGSYILEKKQFDIIPNWKGHFSRGNYSISPVKKEMFKVFTTFIKDHLQLSDHEDNNSTSDWDRYRFKVGNCELSVSYLEKLESVFFSEHFANKEESCSEAIQNIGNAFNEVLDKPEYQKMFTSY